MSKKTKRSKPKRLLLTDRSINDLAAIELYSIEQWGKKTAAKYLAQIEDTLSLIKSNPGILRQEESIPEFLQFYTVKKHVLVFYRQGNEIILVAVLHDSRDIPSRLAELEPMLAMEVELMHCKLSNR